eukprot:100816-Chlamydomonas_euryale.AAC.1
MAVNGDVPGLYRRTACSMQERWNVIDSCYGRVALGFPAPVATFYCGACNAAVPRATPLGSLCRFGLHLQSPFLL